MRRAWAWLGVVAACAGCALDEQRDDGGSDVAVARKKLRECKSKKHEKPKKHEPPCYTTTTVGATGGVVEHPHGVTLSVPAGALDHDVAISVLDEGAAGPDNTTMYSPVFTFEPDGTLFARPVQVQFEVGDTVSESTVYWTRSTSSGIVWDRIAATVTGGVATSQITHFSSGGAGVPSDELDLHIIQSRTWHRLDGTEIELTDFATGSAIAHAPGGNIASEAWVGADGLPVPGEGMIRNIPAGEMWIQLGNKWVFTSLATTPVIDLSTERFGTKGRPAPDPNQPHPVTVRFHDAEPTHGFDPADPAAPVDLQTCDAFELLVPDANAFFYAFPENVGEAVVPSGATTFDLTWDLNSPSAVNNFITTADKAYFAQVVPKTTPAPASLPYLQMAKIGIASPADVPQTGGLLDVTLADLPETSSQAYTIAAGEYQSMFATNDPDPDPLLAPPNGQSSGWATDVRVVNFRGLDISSGYFGLQGMAGSQVREPNVLIGATADFAYMNLPSSVMSGTFDTGSLSYGVPTGPDERWDTFAGLTGSALFFIQLRCPVDATPCSTPAGWARHAVNNALDVGYTDARLVSDTNVAPTIGPATNVQINGADARQLQSGVGLQPTISWSPTTSVPIAPFRALELPQAYHVIVFRYVLDSSSGQWRTRRVLVADLTTTYTSMTLPATILAPGEVYSVAVRATKRDATLTISPLQEPGRFRYPATDWTTATAPFTP